jgi:hypothetical protein
MGTLGSKCQPSGSNYRDLPALLPSPWGPARKSSGEIAIHGQIAI